MLDGALRAPPGRSLLGQETCGRPQLTRLPPFLHPEGKYVGKAAALPWAGPATGLGSGEFIRAARKATAEEPDPACLWQPNRNRLSKRTKWRGAERQGAVLALEPGRPSLTCSMTFNKPCLISHPPFAPALSPFCLGLPKR